MDSAYTSEISLFSKIVPSGPSTGHYVKGFHMTQSAG